MVIAQSGRRHASELKEPLLPGARLCAVVPMDRRQTRPTCLVLETRPPAEVAGSASAGARPFSRGLRTVRRMGTYPFGRPVTAHPPSASRRCGVLVLGAYPSALHIRWVPPPESELRPVKRFPSTMSRIRSGPETTLTCASLAGSTTLGGVGVGVVRYRRPHRSVQRSLRLLGGDKSVRCSRPQRADTWITDCLDTYCGSTGVTAAVAAVYTPFAVRVGLPAADLEPHPSELSDCVGDRRLTA